MSKKPKDTDEQDDPDLAAQEALQKKFEAEALATPAADAVEPYEGMPARFDTGGATAEEKAAWIEAHGGPKVEGVVEPGHAEPKAEGDVPPQ